MAGAAAGVAAATAVVAGVAAADAIKAAVDEADKADAERAAAEGRIAAKTKG